jgi:hypothetical protein
MVRRKHYNVTLHVLFMFCCECCRNTFY